MSIYSIYRNFKKRWELLSRIWLPFAKSGAAFYGAAACYYTALSIFPISALILSVLSYFPSGSPVFLSWVTTLFPHQFRDPLLRFLSSIQPDLAAVGISSSLLVTLWSASKGISAITEGLNAMMGDSTRHSFLRRRLEGMLAFFCLTIVLSVVLVIQICSSKLFTTLFSFSVSELPFRHLFTFAALLLIFSLLYRFLPSIKTPFRFCLYAGSFTALGWISFSSIFSIYLNHFDKYHTFFGGIGLIIPACLWFQVCITLVLYGALLARLLRQNGYHPIRYMIEFFQK